MAVTLRNVKGTRLTHAEMDENFKAVMGGHNFLHIQDQKAQGTAGGTFTNGAWRTRDLNTVLTNTISGASLSGNQITLPAGKYYVEAYAPAYLSNQHQAKFTRTTGGTIDVLLGNSTYAGNAVGGAAFVSGVFQINTEHVFELQHRCSYTSANGFGHAANFTTEVYSKIRIWRIGEYVAE